MRYVGCKDPLLYTLYVVHFKGEQLGICDSTSPYSLDYTQQKKTKTKSSRGEKIKVNIIKNNVLFQNIYVLENQST